MLFKQVISTQPYYQWIWQNNENKQLLYFSALVMALSFGWLKYVYPYPNFMPPDSYSYLDAANDNDLINMWPIGYSKFLRLVSVFTRSHLLLVILQYLLLQISVLNFLFTIRYLLSPGKWLFRTILAFSITNPLLPHIANFVSSDSLFASLSLVWFTQLLWILYKSNRKLLIAHAIVLLLSFTVRFTAVYYPFVSIIIIYSAHMPAKRMWLGISCIAFLLLAFIGRTQYEYKVRTDTIQYSAFGGWQMAANALYGYAHADSISVNRTPSKFRELHAMVNRHMDSIRHLIKRPDAEPGVYYLWDFKSPLVLYLKKQWPKDKKVEYFEQWAKVGPLYSKYGRWLIMHHPWPFIKHYAWPNMLKYYGPPTFFMGKYNLGKKKVDSIAVTWFNWKDNQLHGRFKDRKIHIMDFFPNLLAIINPSFLVIAVFFMGFAGLKQCSKISKQILYCLTLVWFANTLFSVMSAPIELRYQIFPVVITVPFCLLLLSWITQSLKVETITINPKTIIAEN
jgi:hypothetical protein